MGSMRILLGLGRISRVANPIARVQTPPGRLRLGLLCILRRLVILEPVSWDQVPKQLVYLIMRCHSHRESERLTRHSSSLASFQSW